MRRAAIARQDATFGPHQVDAAAENGQRVNALGCRDFGHLWAEPLGEAVGHRVVEAHVVHHRAIDLESRANDGGHGVEHERRLVGTEGHLRKLVQGGGVGKLLHSSSPRAEAAFDHCCGAGAVLQSKFAVIEPSRTPHRRLAGLRRCDRRSAVAEPVHSWGRRTSCRSALALVVEPKFVEVVGALVFVADVGAQEAVACIMQPHRGRRPCQALQLAGKGYGSAI